MIFMKIIILALHFLAVSVMPVCVLCVCELHTIVLIAGQVASYHLLLQNRVAK